MNNEQTILQILENASIIFDSSIYYNKFMGHIHKGQYQQARFFLDVEMDSVNKDSIENDIRYNLYDETESGFMETANQTPQAPQPTQPTQPIKKVEIIEEF